MEKLNCSAGDLAIAIKAHNPSNIGNIVNMFKTTQIWPAILKLGSGGLCRTSQAADTTRGG